MVKSRFIYAVVLLVAFCFMVFLYASLSVAVFLTILMLPVLSLIYVLVERALVDIRTEPPEAVIERGGLFSFRVLVHNRSILPFMPVRLSLRCPTRDNEGVQRIFVMVPSHARYSFSRDMDCRFRGEYIGGINKVIFVDLLGLFSFKKNIEGNVRLLVTPRRLQPGFLPAMVENAAEENAVMQRKSGDSTDVSEIRDYRPGDNLRAIHWKLSSRLQESFVVRQYEQDKEGMVLIAANLRYPPGFEGEYDPLGDAVVELSLGFAEQCVLAGRDCRILWHEERTGADAYLDITNAVTLDAAVLNFGVAPIYHGTPSIESILPPESDVYMLYVVTVRVEPLLADTLLERLKIASQPIGLVVVDSVLPKDEMKLLENLEAAGIKVIRVAWNAGNSQE